MEVVLNWAKIPLLWGNKIPEIFEVGSSAKCMFFESVLDKFLKPNALKESKGAIWSQ